jgi:hypothetical protein
MKSAITWVGCIVRFVGRYVLPVGFIGVLALGISFVHAQTLPQATSYIYTQAGPSSTSNPVEFNVTEGKAYNNSHTGTGYTADGNISVSFGTNAPVGINGQAFTTTSQLYAQAYATAGANLRFYFRVVQVGNLPWQPPSIPTLFRASGQGEVSKGYGIFDASAFVGGFPDFPSNLFKIHWEGGPSSASFNQTITLDLLINSQYQVLLAATAYAYSAFNLDRESSVYAYVDLIISFDQATFDARYPGNSFPLSDYYSLELSPNVIVNRPPVLDLIGNKQGSEGELLQFTITASDPDGNALTYSASNLPAGATFDPTTQTFSWTPDYTQAGNYNVLFSVTDNGTPPMSASEEITVTVGNVNRPPVLNPIGDKTVNEGQLLQFTITATDPDGNELTYSGSNLPNGAAFDPGSQTFTWIPGYDQYGNYTDVRFTVTDNGVPSASASEAITITVGNVNRPPILAPIGDRIGTEGELLEFTITATDLDGDVLTYSASDLPSGATFDPFAQKFSWTPGYDQSGNHTIEFTVTDNGSPVEVDSEVVTITVGNVNRAPVFAPVGTQQVVENQLLQFSVMATDYDGDAITYSTGPLPSGASFDPAGRLFSWRPDSSQAGTYTVVFYAADSGLPPMQGELDVVINVGDVATPCQLADQIIQTVLSLNLPKSVENSYMANLKKVCRFVEDGKILRAIIQLDVFIAKVVIDIVQHDISEAAGRNLINMAIDLIRLLRS